MSDKNMAVEFVRYVLQQICEHKSDIVIEEVEDDRGLVIMVKVNEADMGRLIGREGQTVTALRTLLVSISAREGKRYYLKVVEAEGKV